MKTTKLNPHSIMRIKNPWSTYLNELSILYIVNTENKRIKRIMIVSKWLKRIMMIENYYKFSVLIRSTSLFEYISLFKLHLEAVLWFSSSLLRFWTTISINRTKKKFEKSFNIVFYQQWQLFQKLKRWMTKVLKRTLKS